MMFPSVVQNINAKVRVVNLMTSFWGIFWLLNGLDKFFNGEYFFGVTRDDKFVAYFAGLGLNSEIALAFLYSCGVCEIILGIGFLLALRKTKAQNELIQACLKAGMLIFITFSVFDILFGDRAELWEHSTFLLLHIVSIAFVLFIKAIQDLREDPNTLFSRHTNNPT